MVQLGSHAIDTKLSDLMSTITKSNIMYTEVYIVKRQTKCDMEKSLDSVEENFNLCLFVLMGRGKGEELGVPVTG